jgi:hypothetical protein
MTTDFYDAMKREANLFDAWLHVRKSAWSSLSDDIKKEINEFEKAISKNIKSINHRLARDKYIFPKSHGVLKEKIERKRLGKSPRPIVISKIEGKIVERAILNVLQPKPKDSLYSKAGALIGVIESPFSSGGLSGQFGGVDITISRILKAFDDGYLYYFRSDISKFFTLIPQNTVKNFILKNTSDQKISNIFHDALSIELDNYRDLKDHVSLFPHNNIGVPQGSSLSALAGNILLGQLDEDLNALGIRAYRYIDDIVLLAKSSKELKPARIFANKEFEKFDMRLYQPSEGGGKSAEGNVLDSELEFLGCRIKKNQVSPNKKNKQSLLSKVDIQISEAKTYIINMSNGKNSDRKLNRAYSSTLKSLDNKIYGWSQSFSFTNNPMELRQLDIAISERLNKFTGWYIGHTKKLEDDRKRRAMGVSLITDVESNYDTMRKKCQ